MTKLARHSFGLINRGSRNQEKSTHPIITNRSHHYTLLQQKSNSFLYHGNYSNIRLEFQNSKNPKDSFLAFSPEFLRKQEKKDANHHKVMAI